MKCMSARMGVIAAPLCASSVATAQAIIPIAPFTAHHRESFNALQTFFVQNLLCFDGAASANQLGGTLGIAVTNGFGTACGTMWARSGKLMLPWKGTNVEWVFDRPAARFGGWFGTICQEPGATAWFYDESGALMATVPMSCPTQGQWSWNGWKAAGAGFKRVRIVADDPDGHVLHDDMELDFDGRCYADCDASGLLAVTDFTCFRDWFLAQDPRADCTANGALTIADFACFQTAFVQGCP